MSSSHPQVRTGCFCNTGACQRWLALTDEDTKKLHKVRARLGEPVSECCPPQAGHVCGDSVDLVDSRPTGSVRVSFGYMSTVQDVRLGCITKYLH